MPRPSGSPSVSRAIVKLPPAWDSQMYCARRGHVCQRLFQESSRAWPQPSQKCLNMLEVEGETVEGPLLARHGGSDDNQQQQTNGAETPEHFRLTGE